MLYSVLNDVNVWLLLVIMMCLSVGYLVCKVVVSGW